MHLAWKIVKIFIYILSGLVLLLFAASFFIDPVAKRLLENEVGKADEGQYTLQLDDINISLLRGNVLMKGISFRTDTAGRELAPVVLVEAREFSAKGVSWLTFVLERRLLIDQLALDGLNLQLKARPVDTAQTGEPFRFHQLDIYPNIREKVRMIHLQDLALNNIDFTLINALSQDTLQFSADRLDLHSKDILIDADKLITEERAFYAAYIDFDGEQLQLRRSGNKSWNAGLELLNVLTREDKFDVLLKSLHFLQSADTASDTLMLVDMQHFELQDLNLHKLQEDEMADIHEIRLSGLNFVNNKGGPSGEDTEEAAGSDQARENLPENFSQFSLGRFLPDFASSLRLETLQLDSIHYRQGAALSINNFGVTANNIFLDRKSAFADERFLHAVNLQSTIEQFEYLAKDAGYRIRWDSLQLEAEEGIARLMIRQLAAEPNEKDYGVSWLNGEIARLQLDNIDTRRLEEDVLHIGRVSTDHPSLLLYLQPDTSPGSAGRGTGAFPDLYPALEGVLQVLSIDRLEVQEGNLQLTEAGGKFGSLSVPHWNVRLDEILIDRQSALTADRLLHSRELWLDAAGITYRFPDNKNSLQLGAVSLSSPAKSLSLRSLHYGSPNTTKERVEEPDHQLSAVNIQAMEFQGVDFYQLFRGEGLQASGFGMHGTDIRLAGSNSKPEHRPALPPEDDKQETGESSPFRLADLNLADQLPAFLKKIEVDAVEITGMNVMEEEGLGLGNLWLQASSFRLNNNSAFADNHFLHARTFKTGFDTLWVQAGDPIHYLIAKDLEYTVEEGLGKLVLGQVIIKPEDNPLNKAWIEADIPELVIPNINTRELSEGILTLDEVLISKPVVVAHNPSEKRERGDASGQESSSPDLFPLIENGLSEFSLEKLAVEDGEVRLAGFGGSYYGMSLHEINMQLNDLHIARGTAFTEERLVHTKNINLTLGKLILLFPDQVYSLQLNALELNSTNKSLKAGGLRYEYGNNFKSILEGPEKNDVYRLVNKELMAEGIDYQGLLRDGEFRVRTVSLNGLDLYIYKDLNMPEEERIKPMPRDIILNMGMPLTIDSLQVDDFAITYEEMAEDAASAGLVTLMDVSARINNISNIRSDLVNQPDMQLTASGRLMGRGYFETKIDVPLLDEHKKLRIKGSIDTLDMSRLNRISRYNSRIAIEEGTLYRANWDFEADSELASGDFEVSYEDLRVQMSSKNSPDTTGVLKDIGSFLLNLVVVDENIAEAKTKEPKKVVFEEKRNKNKSFFNFYVRSLLAGLMEAIGVPFQ